MLGHIKQVLYIFHITYFLHALGICQWCCTPNTILEPGRKLQSHMRHGIEWIIAFLDGCIVTKIPMRREYEVNPDACPFTHGNGVLAVATSAGNTVLPQPRATRPDMDVSLLLGVCTTPQILPRAKEEDCETRSS